jgi:hypothetical protein
MQTLITGPLLVALLVAQSATPTFRPEWSVILSERPLPSGQFWCSRSGPALRDYWRPDPEIIRELEVALAPALQRALDHASDRRWNPPAIDEFYRQYIGIRAGSRRAVYINGFHRSYLTITADSRPESAGMWRTRAVNVCDGGTMFFGADYDPATRTIGNIEFNVRGVPSYPNPQNRNRQSTIGNRQSSIGN